MFILKTASGILLRFSSLISFGMYFPRISSSIYLRFSVEIALEIHSDSFILRDSYRNLSRGCILVLPRIFLEIPSGIPLVCSGFSLNIAPVIPLGVFPDFV